MTFREKLKKALFDRGLFEDEAGAVFAEVEANSPSMQGRWDHDTTGYPDSMFDVLWLITKRFAVKWIEANKPMHWAKPMFLPDA